MWEKICVYRHVTKIRLRKQRFIYMVHDNEIHGVRTNTEIRSNLEGG